MCEYLAGWRRKLGLVTLTLAMLFMGAWLRSRVVVDSIHFTSGKMTWDELISLDNTLFWRRNHLKIGEAPPKSRWERRSSSEFPPVPEDVSIPWFWRRCGLGWYERWRGFGIGKLVEDPNDSIQVIPYWCIAIPLTICSAYCLLAKSKIPKTTATVKSNPA